jgi:pimeloyl-ACP methyl ester carboxylesterase
MKTMYVQSGDVKLHVKTSEPENKENPETILFLHGFPDTHKTWEFQVEAFKNEYRIIAFDCRGVGSSTAPARRSGYHIDNLLQDVTSVIDTVVGRETKVHLVGHDWGAVILWCYVSFPILSKRVASFTAINGPHPSLFVKNLRDSLFSFDPFSLFSSISQLTKSWYILFFQIPRLPETVLMTAPEFFWKMLHSKSGISEDDEMRNYTREEILSSSLGSINLYREMLQGGLPPLPEEPIQIPITMIVSDNDLGLDRLAFEQSEKIATHLDVRMFKANHWVHREKPDDVNRLLSIFLRRVGAKK